MVVVFLGNNNIVKFKKGVKKMKNAMNFAKGMGAGIVAGMAMAGALKYAADHNRKFKRNTDKATKAMSNIIDDIQALLN